MPTDAKFELCRIISEATLFYCSEVWTLHKSGRSSNKIRLLVVLIKLYTFKYHVSRTDGKISVGIIYFYYLFFHSRPTHKLCFLSCRPFFFNVTFSTGLVVSSVTCPSQETEKTIRPVENVM